MQSVECESGGEKRMNFCVPRRNNKGLIPLGDCVNLFLRPPWVSHPPFGLRLSYLWLSVLGCFSVDLYLANENTHCPHELNQ